MFYAEWSSLTSYSNIFFQLSKCVFLNWFWFFHIVLENSVNFHVFITADGYEYFRQIRLIKSIFWEKFIQHV